MFQKAVPIFAEGKENEKNYQLVLRAEQYSIAGTVLYITAASFYRVWVNGKFIAFGPARTAKGYARVDVLSLDGYQISGGNEIVIEVAGYACRSLSTVCQPSFVVAELRRGEHVLLYTDSEDGGFEGYCSCRRVQKAERYSYQRHFGEIWDYTEREPFSDKYRVRLARSENHPTYLPRRVPYADFKYIASPIFSSKGRFGYSENRPCRPNRYSKKTIPEEWGQYGEDEAYSLPYRWLQKQELTMTEGQGTLPVELCEGEYVTVDMRSIKAGFITWSAIAELDSDIVLGFCEFCDPEKFKFDNINAQNVIEYFVSEGDRVNTVSFEPYTCRVATLMVKKGKILLCSFGVKTFEFDRSLIKERSVRDESLKKIYSAAVSSFAHNVVDLYFDCPSRERAGWLCDSFFTARVEYFLTGKTDVEDAFLENYRLFRNDDGEWPEGVLPMCYPADYNGEFIPQWNMWYVLEACEYLTLRNPSCDKELFRNSIFGVLGFLSRYENSDGLLQDLPNWNFVEWSTANKWVQNVNYPTNFLYAEVLSAVGALYGIPKLEEKAKKLRKLTAERSFDGEVFIDNAVLSEDGELHNTRNSSEAGQYYAILFGKIDLDAPEYSKLKAYVKDGFSSFCTEGREFVEVNAFIGFYLRIMVLMNLGDNASLEDNIKTFFGNMADLTGTLWEYKDGKGSRDHGFASYATIAIDLIEKSRR